MRPEEGYHVTERGPHHRVWARVTSHADATGRMTTETNTYTELATGLHYLEGDAWRESSAAIAPALDGAWAVTGPHQAWFADNARTAGALRVLLPDGTELGCHLLGLCYFSPATGQRVWLAELVEAGAELEAPDALVYPGALQGWLSADLRYHYRRDGLEQDVILRHALPDPARWGLRGDGLEVQVVTEFLAAPEPVLEAQSLPGGAPTVEIRFGDFHTVPGEAFALGAGADVRPIPVAKRWEVLEGRRLLIEAVPFVRLREAARHLPVWIAAREAAPGPGASGLPALPPALRLPRSVELAQAPTPEPPGCVLDWLFVYGQSNLTFKGDTTYYVSGAVNLSGTTTLEGGAVVKFTNSPAARLNLNGPLVCATAPYRPAVLTSRNDNAVGETISGSTGNPTSNDGAIYLYAAASQTNAYRHLRFAYAGTAISHSGEMDIWHSQFANAGQYRVRVTDGSGTFLDSAGARLHVNSTPEDPRLECQADNPNPGLGQPVTFTAALDTSPSPGPIYYQWRKNAVPIPGASGQCQGQHPVYTATYTKSPVACGDSGEYSVVFTNSFWKIANLVNAAVSVAAPAVTVTPSSPVYISDRNEPPPLVATSCFTPVCARWYRWDPLLGIWQPMPEGAAMMELHFATPVPCETIYTTFKVEVFDAGRIPYPSEEIFVWGDCQP